MREQPDAPAFERCPQRRVAHQSIDTELNGHGVRRSVTPMVDVSAEGPRARRLDAPIVRSFAASLAAADSGSRSREYASSKTQTWSSVVSSESRHGNASSAAYAAACDPSWFAMPGFVRVPFGAT